MKYLLPLLALPALAQFSGLTTTPDGSTLYFVSTLRQRNTTQPLHGKVFSLDDRELKPVLILDRIQQDASWTNFFDITTPLLDANGTLAGHTANRVCSLSSFKDCYQFKAGTWLGKQYIGSLTFSPNRRYLLQSVPTGLLIDTLNLIDLNTGQTLATTTGLNGGILVTDEGSVLSNAGCCLLRLAPGGSEFELIRFTPNLELSGLATLPGTSRLLSWQITAPTSQLLEIDPNTRLQTPIGPPTIGFCSSIAAAAQGILVGGCSTGTSQQLLRLDSAQSEWRTIATNIQSWTLSADGNVLWYLTTDLAFHKVNLIRETDETRLPAFGVLNTNDEPTSPGSLFYLNGRSLRELALFLKRGSESTELTPVLRSETQVVYRIPENFPNPLDEYSLEFLNRAPSFFEFRQTLPTRIVPIAPAFFTTPDAANAPTPSRFAYNPLAANAGFTHLITRDNPVRPNDIIHLWAVNLGPSENGRLTTPNFTCFGPGTFNAQILYAGPAPGIAGIYQLSLRMPPELQISNSPHATISLACGFYGELQFEAFLRLPAAL